MSTEATKATGGVVSHAPRKAAAQRSQGAAGDASTFDNTKACVALEAKGFNLAPLPAGKKFAPPPGWNAKGAAFKWRTSNNIAILTEFHGEGALLVLDVDVKGDVDGVASLAKLEAEHGDLPPTLIHSTPTGGHHIVYRVADAVQSTAGKLGPGLDVRSASGYIVAPGSVTDKGEYTVERDAPIADAPRWLIDLCGQPRERQPREEAKPLTGQAAESAVKLAMRYLQDEAPEAIEGAGGDRKTYEVACEVRDFGVPEAACVELMLEHWNDRCAPSWSPDELAAKVANAYRYATGDFAGDNPAAVFDKVQEAPSAKAATDEADTKYTPRFRIVPAGALLNRPPRQWLVKGVIAEHGIGVIYGEPGSGKTFLTLDIAAAIARGTPWGGRKVRKGLVVYVGLEGAQQTRVAAYIRENELEPDGIDDVLVIEQQAFDLLHPQCKPAIALAADIEHIANGRPVRAVFIDTLNRAMQGADENSSSDMGQAIAAAQAIADRLKCAAIFVHHCGKDAGKGARGHSSLHGATEFELLVTKKADGEHEAKAAKVKDGADGVRWKFRLGVVPLGRDPDGEPLTSCAVVDLAPVEKRDPSLPKEPSPTESVVLMALRELTHARGNDPTTGGEPFAEILVSRDDWVQAYLDMESTPTTGAAAPSPTGFRTASKRLVEKGHVRDCGRGRYALLEQ